MKAKKKFRVLKDLTSDLNIEQAVAHTKLIASPALKPSVVNRNTSIATNSIVNIPVPFTKLELKLDFNSQNFPHKQPINFNSNSVSDSSKLLKNSMKKSVKASKVAKKTYQKCTHDKFKPNCKVCSPHRFCVHEHQKSNCKECGTGRCAHGNQKSNCKECMSMEELEAKGFVCKICFAKSTRNGVCKQCSLSFISSSDVSIEGLVKHCLRHFFGDAMESNYRKQIGGVYCKDSIDGEDDCQDKTKAAYVDIPIVLQDRVIFSEVDENQHRYYDVSCELARYDTLTFGTEQLRATFINRFNPHNTPEVTVPFIDRVKAFIQTIRNQLRCPLLSEDEKVSASVSYLFYGSGSVHQESAQHAKMTFRILPYINNPTDLKLDLDIAAFKLEDLVQKEINATTQEILIQRQIELSSSSNQCSAWNHPKNPAKKTRCSQASKKNSTLCFRHSKLQEEGRTVVLVDL